MQDDVYIVIMAGGAGTRFWPLSRRAMPKQLLALGSAGESLIAATLRRVRPIVPAERVIVVTNAALVDATRRELPDVPAENFLAEPVGRNTAPCIGWAAAVAAARTPGARLVVLPADHHIAKETGFVQTLETAVAAAAGETLVTVGIRPTRPETGYGYIELGASVCENVFAAARFIEKPDRERAEQYIASSRYLWNSGMFVFGAQAILNAIRTHLPDLAQGLDVISAAKTAPDRARAIAEVFPRLPPISIDYGVMEKASSVHVVPGDFGWSDVGSWLATWELAPHDAQGNALVGPAIALDSHDCFIRAMENKTIAVLGLSNLVVVDTPDALLILPRDRAQDVRAIVDELRKRGRTELL